MVSVLDLGSLVTDGSYNLVSDFRWNLAHLVLGSRVLGHLSEDFFFTVAAGDKITVRADVSATHGLCHGTSLWRPSLAQAGRHGSQKKPDASESGKNN